MLFLHAWKWYRYTWENLADISEPQVIHLEQKDPICQSDKYELMIYSESKSVIFSLVVTYH